MGSYEHKTDDFRQRPQEGFLPSQRTCCEVHEVHADLNRISTISELRDLWLRRKTQIAKLRNEKIG